jgi:hypothetical protein
VAAPPHMSPFPPRRRDTELAALARQFAEAVAGVIERGGRPARHGSRARGRAGRPR